MQEKKNKIESLNNKFFVIYSGYISEQQIVKQLRVINLKKYYEIMKTRFNAQEDKHGGLYFTEKQNAQDALEYLESFEVMEKIKKGGY